MNKNILEINNLEKKYFTKEGETLAIKDLSFTVEDQDFLAIVGPSGCGKSTLFSIISNLESPTNGTFTTHNKTIGYMFQQDCLFPWLTILENCLLGLKIQNKLTKETKENVINLLKTYDLENFINNYPSSLSGGMKQRVLRI